MQYERLRTSHCPVARTQSLNTEAVYAANNQENNPYVRISPTKFKINPFVESALSTSYPAALGTLATFGTAPADRPESVCPPGEENRKPGRYGTLVRAEHSHLGTVGTQRGASDIQWTEQRSVA